MKSEEKPLLILGTGTFASEVADIVSETPGYRLAGFVENMDPAKCEGTLEGLPVYWIDDSAHLAGTHYAICALGTTKRVRFIDQAKKAGFRFATLIHPTVRISATSSVGEGSIVNAGTVVASHAHIGKHVILNRGVLIGHHTRIDDCCRISPGANIAGCCTIGKTVYIGMSAIVLDHKTVGDASVIGAGAVATKDIPGHVEAVGIPARIVKENITGR